MRCVLVAALSISSAVEVVPGQRVERVVFRRLISILEQVLCDVSQETPYNTNELDESMGSSVPTPLDENISTDL